MEKLNQLTSKVEALETSDAAKTSQIAELQSQLQTLQSRVDALENATPAPPTVNPEVDARLRRTNLRLRTLRGNFATHVQVSNIAALHHSLQFRSSAGSFHVVLGIFQRNNLNECESSPCANGGNCYDRFMGFVCICPDNWEVRRY